MVFVVVVGRGVDVGVLVETVVLVVGRGVEIVWLLVDVPSVGVVVLVEFVLLLVGEERRGTLPMMRGSVSCEVLFADGAEAVGVARDGSFVVAVPVAFLVAALVVALAAWLVVWSPEGSSSESPKNTRRFRYL